MTVNRSFWNLFPIPEINSDLNCDSKFLIRGFPQTTVHPIWQPSFQVGLQLEKVSRNLVIQSTHLSWQSQPTWLSVNPLSFHFDWPLDIKGAVQLGCLWKSWFSVNPLLWVEPLFKWVDLGVELFLAQNLEWKLDWPVCRNPLISVSGVRSSTT